MSQEQLKPGDEVRHKGDTQVMVILSEQDGDGCFLCQWKEGGEIRNDRFPAVVLEKVKKPTAGAFWLGKK